MLKEIVYNISSFLMYIFVYIEIFFNYVKNCTNIEDSSDLFILLVNTNNETCKKLKLDNNDDFNYDYEFGIIEKKINNKIYHYIFCDSVDTEDVDDFLNSPIENVIFSAEISIPNLDINHSIDITNINYFLKGNSIFFKEHILYILRKHYNIYSNIEYSINIIDHMCNNIIITHKEYLLLESDNDLLYKIVSK